MILSSLLLLVSCLNAAGNLPVFIPNDHSYVQNVIFESVADMTYGQESFVLLESNQPAVILVGVGTREVVELDVSDGTFIEFGNGVFVIAGSQGSIARSANLFDWEYRYFDGNSIQNGVVEASDASRLHEKFVALKYLPAHQHFFAKTESGKILVSQNGAEWSIWGNTADGGDIPQSDFPLISESMAVFKHDGNYLKFELLDSQSGLWQVSLSSDGQRWEPDGTIPLWERPSKVYKRRTWVGLAGQTCFLKVGNQWMTETRKEGDVWTYATAYSTGRSFNTRMLAIRQAQLYEYYHAGYWSPVLSESLEGCFVNGLNYLPGLDRFFMFTYESDHYKVQCTYDGTSLVEVLDDPSFNPTSIVEADHRLMITGSGREDGKPIILVSTDRIQDSASLDASLGVPFIDVTDEGIDWTAFKYPESPTSPVIKGFDGAFYLATDFQVFRSRDGKNWTSVFQITDHSWIQSMYVYRGRLWIGTTNFVIAHHIYLPPPEGEAEQSNLYWSDDGEQWKSEPLDNQRYSNAPSTDGPMLLDFQSRWLNDTVVLSGTDGEHLQLCQAPWSLLHGTFQWAYGRYFLFSDTAVCRTRFMGFKDADYYARTDQGEQSDDIWINTGYFGKLKVSDGNPFSINHYTLGALQLSEHSLDNLTWEVLSDQFGVATYDTSWAPYLQNKVDGHLYFVNFAAEDVVDHVAPFRYYDHTTATWTDEMACEQFTYQQWFDEFTTSVLGVERSGSDLVQALGSYSIVDLRTRFHNSLKMQFARFQTFKRVVERKLAELAEAEQASESVNILQWSARAEDAFSNAMSSYQHFLEYPR